jgi:hypothetical protein
MPCSLVVRCRRIGGTCCCYLQNTLKMEAAYSSELQVTISQTTWRRISEDSNVHSHHCEDLKSFIQINTISYI